MGKPLKIITVIVSVILLVLVALIVLAKVVITPERVRATVLPLAEEQLNRKVDFSGLNVSIFSGITLEGFTVFEADGEQKFVSLNGLVLSYRLLPLLTGKVVVNEVRFDKPRIRVVRNIDGSFNFSTLGKQLDEAVEEEAQQKQPAEASAGGGGIDLLVAQVRVSEGEVQYRDLALQPDIPFELTLSEINMLARDISLEQRFPFELEAMFAGAPLSVQGDINPVTSAGNFSVGLQGLALKNFKTLAGEGYPGHLEPLTLDLDLKGGGGPESAKVSGTASLGMAGQTVEARLEAPDLMAAIIPLTLEVNSGSLQLDKLLPPEQAKAGAEQKSGAKQKGGAKTSAQEPGPIELPLRADGKVSVHTLAYNTLTLQDVALDWSLVNNIFTLKRLDAGMAEGTLHGTSRVDLAKRGFVYVATFDVAGVQADPLVSAFYPDYRNVVTGGLDLNLDMQGRGTQSEAIKRNLTGEGRLKIHEGRVSGGAVLEGLAVFLGSEELRDLSFSDGAADFRIENGKITFDSRFVGSKARMQPNGQVGLDGSLDVRLETRLNPELTRKVAGKSEFASALKDEQGWGLFPLQVKGSMDKPRFTLDSKAARKQIKEQVKQKAVEELSKELFKDDASKGAGEKALKDTLKGLLGN